MKELLIKLQSFPNTWEKFETLWWIKGNSIKLLNLLPDYETIDEKEIAYIEKLLTDFCDGEGYYIVANLDKYRKWNATVRQIEENLDCLFYVSGYPASRQEAFNAGVEKAFSLMEKEK